MTRPKRSGHKKSTAGCANCKRRHVKCDETRPSCVNCITHGRTCPYLNESRLGVAGLTPNTTSPDEEAASSSLILPSRNASTDPADAPTPGVLLNLPNPWFDLPYIGLLQQWLSETHRSYVFNDEHAKIYGSIILDQALAFPFLMHTILANAALHLSLKHPDKAVAYRRTADELSSQALSEFNAAMSEIDAKSIVAAFLFSNVISAHQMCTCFLAMTNDFGCFIMNFVECLRISRGVSIVIRGWWPFLLETELGPILSMSERLQAEHDIDRHSQEFDNIRALVESLKDINSSSTTETYLSAIETLQRCFNVQCILDSPELNASTSWAFAWPVNASPELIALLEMKRPEALVLLAHYAPLLHYRRHSWAVKQAGQTMLRLIESALGSTWTKWLQWPRDAMGAE